MSDKKYLINFTQNGEKYYVRDLEAHEAIEKINNYKIDLVLDKNTYELQAIIKDSNGNTVSDQGVKVDFPSEYAIQLCRYNSLTKELEFETNLPAHNFSVSVAGLIADINSPCSNLNGRHNTNKNSANVNMSGQSNTNGNDNEHAENSSITGHSNVNRAVRSMMGGFNNYNSGADSITTGYNCRNNAQGGITGGVGTRNFTQNGIVAGRYNKDNGIDGSTLLMALGDGTSDSSRHNAFEVSGTGVARSNVDKSLILRNKDLITKEFADYTYELKSDISSVYKFKGSVATYNNLPNNLTTSETGWVYGVLDTGDHYAWTGTAWDKLPGAVDLSGYYTKTETDVLLSEQEVIANPVETGLIDLTKVKIGNTVYNIPSGAGALYKHILYINYMIIDEDEQIVVSYNIHLNIVNTSLVPITAANINDYISVLNNAISYSGYIDIFNASYPFLDFNITKYQFFTNNERPNTLISVDFINNEFNVNTINISRTDITISDNVIEL